MGGLQGLIVVVHSSSVDTINQKPGLNACLAALPQLEHLSLDCRATAHLFDPENDLSRLKSLRIFSETYYPQIQQIVGHSAHPSLPLHALTERPRFQFPQQCVGRLKACTRLEIGSQNPWPLACLRDILRESPAIGHLELRLDTILLDFANNIQTLHQIIQPLAASLKSLTVETPQEYHPEKSFLHFLNLSKMPRLETLCLSSSCFVVPGGLPPKLEAITWKFLCATPTRRHLCLGNIFDKNRQKWIRQFAKDVVKAQVPLKTIRLELAPGGLGFTQDCGAECFVSGLYPWDVAGDIADQIYRETSIKVFYDEPSVDKTDFQMMVNMQIVASDSE